MSLKVVNLDNRPFYSVVKQIIKKRGEKIETLIVTRAEQASSREYIDEKWKEGGWCGWILSEKQQKHADSRAHTETSDRPDRPTEEREK